MERRKFTREFKLEAVRLINCVKQTGEIERMPDPNKHVIDFLNHYCSPSNVFDYAAMITGPWGSGKTYLIKKFLAQRKKSGATKDLM